MSQNNTINKSDKKFIRREKARIRSQFLDTKKQNEMIDALYVRFLGTPEVKTAPAPKDLPAGRQEVEAKKAAPVVESVDSLQGKEKVIKKAKPKVKK